MRFGLLAALGALLLAAGCSPSTAVSSGQNTALDSVDLVRMTDRMAQSLGGAQSVTDEHRKIGKLKVVVQPVENQLTGEVLPAGQAEAFMARVRALLSKHEQDKFIWVMNRDAYYRLRQKEMDVDLGPSPNRIQPEYALTARFQSLTEENSKRRTASYLCVYYLTNLKTGEQLWMDRYTVDKKTVKGMLD